MRFSGILTPFCAFFHVTFPPFNLFTLHFIPSGHPTPSPSPPYYVYACLIIQKKWCFLLSSFYLFYQNTETWPIKISETLGPPPPHPPKISNKRERKREKSLKLCRYFVLFLKNIHTCFNVQNCSLCLNISVNVLECKIVIRWILIKCLNFIICIQLCRMSNSTLHMNRITSLIPNAF